MIQFEEGINFKCMMNGHDVRVSDFGEEIPGTGVRKHTCRRCQKHFMRDLKGKLHPWNAMLDHAMDTFKNLEPYKD